MAREKFIKIRVSPDEKSEIEKRAGGNDMSSFIRQVLLDQPIAPQEPKVKKVIHTADPELIRAVNRIGNNINQIAKQVNATKELDNAVLVALLNLQISLDKTLKAVSDDS